MGVSRKQKNGDGFRVFILLVGAARHRVPSFGKKFLNLYITTLLIETFAWFDNYPVQVDVLHQLLVLALELGDVKIKRVRIYFYLHYNFFLKLNKIHHNDTTKEKITLKYGCDFLAGFSDTFLDFGDNMPISPPTDTLWNSNIQIF